MTDPLPPTAEHERALLAAVLLESDVAQCRATLAAASLWPRLPATARSAC